MKYCINLRKENRCLQQFGSYSYSLSMHQLDIEWIASWLNFPPFLIVFTGVANTTNTFIGVEGATKCQIKATSTLNTAKWHPLVPFSPPNTTQCSCIHDQTHQPVVLWIIARCLLVKERWSYLKANWALVDFQQASEASRSKSSLGNF